MSDHPDLSDVGDLSWDEGDLPHQEIKVANVTLRETDLCLLFVQSRY